MLGHPGVALRLMVAHAIAGSPLWTVRVEPQAACAEPIRDSLGASRAEALFDQQRREGLALLGLDPDSPTIRQSTDSPQTLLSTFLRLLALDDAGVMRLLALVMGETLAAAGPAVTAVGETIGIDMADWWQANGAFFDLIRDREVLAAMLTDVAGPAVSTACAGDKAKTLRGVIADCIGGRNGRAKVERWVPRWMAFPATAYTSRGGVGAVTASVLLAAARADAAPEPGMPDPDSASTGAVPLAA